MTRIDPRDHSKIIGAAQSLWPAFEALSAAARTDPVVFSQLVLRDEATGEPITLASMHEEWHDIFDRNDRAVIWTHTEAGKSSLISVGRVLYEIGKNPGIRILILSSTAGAAKKLIKAQKNYIEQSPEYRLVFPNVVPDKSDTTGMWRNDAYIVRRKVTTAKDPTVQACGYGGNVLGGRYDLIIIDDYLDAENTHTDDSREKYYRWLKSTIESRLTAHGRLWFIGNAWHLDDAMHRYAAERRTFSKKFPVMLDGVLSWPDMWPLDRIEKAIEDRGPIESRRSLFCDPVSDAERRFKLEYIYQALVNGDGLELAHALSVVPNGYRTITGVDLAVTKKNSGDLTAFTTIANEERRGIRQLLDLKSGRMSGPEIVDQIIDIHNRYNSLVVVESNAAQMYIRQFTRERSAVPVKPFYTGKNKYDPSFGIESLAIEFSSGKWVLPNTGSERLGKDNCIHATMDPEIKALIGEMLRYDPKSHTGDRLMSAWLAREGVRMGASPAGMGKRPRRT